MTDASVIISSSPIYKEEILKLVATITYKILCTQQALISITLYLITNQMQSFTSFL